MPTLLMSPLGNGRGGWGKRWLVSPEWVILSTWLLKSSSTEDILLWTLTQDTDNFTFSLIQRGVFIYFFPKFLCYQFSQSCVFQVSDLPAKLLATAHESVYNHTACHFPFQERWATRCAAWHSAYWEDFLSPPSFRDVPERGCSTIAVHFQVVSPCCTESSIHQA